MKPIVLDSEQEFNAEEFESYLLGICNLHKKEKRALAFAFIVYAFENYTIKGILEKKDYWVALDKISGKYLTIFYIDSQNSYFERRQKEIYEDEKRNRNQDSNRNSIGLIHSIVLDSTPLDLTISMLKDKFGVEGNIDHPFILFFQSDGASIIDHFVVALKQDELQNAFLELKRQITNAIESVSKVTQENLNNHQEIFNLIKGGVESGNLIYLIKTKIIDKLGIGAVVSLFKTIAGTG